MDAIKLYEKYTMQELVEMMKSHDANPSNRNPPGSLFILTKKARKVSDEIARAITMHLEDKRIAEGRLVKTAGYSGRQTNKRR